MPRWGAKRPQFCARAAIFGAALRPIAAQGRSYKGLRQGGYCARRPSASTAPQAIAMPTSSARLPACSRFITRPR